MAITIIIPLSQTFTCNHRDLIKKKKGSGIKIESIVFSFRRVSFKDRLSENINPFKEGTAYIHMYYI